MTKICVWILVWLLAVVLGISATFISQKFLSQNNSSTQTYLESAGKQTLNMVISSPAFTYNQDLPEKYSCDGQGVNPPIEWSGLPEGTKSLVLTMSDPDAPSGTFYHWLVWNIDPSLGSIGENSLPSGAVQGNDSAGNVGYFAACPPSGVHHYIFTLYALGTSLDLTTGADISALQTAMDAHVMGQAELVGLYGRIK